MISHLWVIPVVIYSKKRRGVRIGERKYSTIFTDFPFFASCDALKSYAQVVDNKYVMPIHSHVASVGFSSFLNHRSLVRIQLRVSQKTRILRYKTRVFSSLAIVQKTKF